MPTNRVVLVPFPFDDLSSSKVRPAVCLTDPIGPHHHVVLAFYYESNPDELVGNRFRHRFTEPRVCSDWTESVFNPSVASIDDSNNCCHLAGTGRTVAHDADTGQRTATRTL